MGSFKLRLCPVWTFRTPSVRNRCAWSASQPSVQRRPPSARQGAVTPGQLDYYLDEFTLGFNRRRSRHRGLLFHRLIEGALAADPHPYTALLTPRTAA